MVLEPDMQFALAAAVAASVLAVAAPALAPHHARLAERSHAAALWNQAVDSRDPLADAAPVSDIAPAE
jgi:hypothetical protein